VKVVILCGGQGTRIRGVADDVPKPMLPIGGVPILQHIMAGYAAAGFNDFVLCLGYQGDVIKNFFSSGRPPINQWRVVMADTGLNTMTGSRVKRVEEHIGNDSDFMLTYGDGVSNIDLHALLAFHHKQKAIVTVSGVRPPARFGEIEHDANGRVTEFNEKPQATAGRISGGFFVCKRALLERLDAGRDDEVLEAKTLQRLAREGQMAMYAHDGFWQCMDTYRDYQLLNTMHEEGKALWMI
jgi:glucose-1-phosphate cytidylyltransferase